jgi:uncharacterized protein with PIN domain
MDRESTSSRASWIRESVAVGDGRIGSERCDNVGVTSVVKGDGTSTRRRDELSRDLVRLVDAMSAADCAASTIRRRREAAEREFDAQLAEHTTRYTAAQDRAARTLQRR